MLRYNAWVMLQMTVHELSGEEAKRQYNDLLVLVFSDYANIEEIREAYSSVVPTGRTSDWVKELTHEVREPFWND